jgi:leader peptidase (prepilin peptidase)/N-methyltransferase
VGAGRYGLAPAAHTPHACDGPAENVHGTLAMQVILFALLGAAAGLLLEPLVVRLAVPSEEAAPPEEHIAAVPFGEAGRARLATLVGEGPLWRRLALVLATTAAFAVAAARYEQPEQAAVISAYAAVLIACAATDLLAFRVPNVITYPAAGGALLAAALMPHGEVTEALIGGAVGGGLMLVIAVVSRGGLGLGDVKLAAFAGLALGGSLILPALMITALAGGLVAAYLALHARRRYQPMPYAPFIAGGALIVLLLQGSAFASL